MKLFDVYPLFGVNIVKGKGDGGDNPLIKAAM